MRENWWRKKKQKPSQINDYGSRSCFSFEWFLLLLMLFSFYMLHIGIFQFHIISFPFDFCVFFFCQFLYSIPGMLAYNASGSSFFFSSLLPNTQSTRSLGLSAQKKKKEEKHCFDRYAIFTEMKLNITHITWSRWLAESTNSEQVTHWNYTGRSTSRNRVHTHREWIGDDDKYG